MERGYASLLTDSDTPTEESALARGPAPPRRRPRAPCSLAFGPAPRRAAPLSARCRGGVQRRAGTHSRSRRACSSWSAFSCGARVSSVHGVGCGSCGATRAEGRGQAGAKSIDDYVLALGFRTFLLCSSSNLLSISSQPWQFDGGSQVASFMEKPCQWTKYSTFRPFSLSRPHLPS